MIKKNIVILARDRAGEKPLYYYKNSSNLSFCSELKGLLKILLLKEIYQLIIYCNFCTKVILLTKDV